MSLRAKELREVFRPLDAGEIVAIRAVMAEIEASGDAVPARRKIQGEGGECYYSLEIEPSRHANGGRYRLVPDCQPRLTVALDECPVLSPDGLRERSDEEFEKVTSRHRDLIARKMTHCIDSIAGPPGTNASHRIGADWELHAWIDGSGTVPRFNLVPVIRAENEVVMDDLGVDSEFARKVEPEEFGLTLRRVCTRHGEVFDPKFCIYGAAWMDDKLGFYDLCKHAQDWPEIEWEYGEIWARAEASGSEGCYVEVARWDREAVEWCKFAFLKILDHGLMEEILPEKGEVKELSADETAEWLAGRINAAHGNKWAAVIHSMPKFGQRQSEQVGVKV